MDDRIDLGPRLHIPRWNGTPLSELEDQQLIQILRALKKLAMLRQRANVWAFSELQEDGGNLMRVFLEAGKQKAREDDWLEYIEQPIFGELEEEINQRGVDWDINEPLDKEIDLSNRGPLERQIVGAIRDCVNAHGPITHDLANSAAKRVIGAIKTYNRKVRRP